VAPGDAGPLGPQVVEHPGVDLRVQPGGVVDGVVSFSLFSLFVGGPAGINDVNQNICRPKVVKKLVAQSSPLRGPRHEACDV